MPLPPPTLPLTALQAPSRRNANVQAFNRGKEAALLGLAVPATTIWEGGGGRVRGGYRNGYECRYIDLDVEIDIDHAIGISTNMNIEIEVS